MSNVQSVAVILLGTALAVHGADKTVTSRDGGFEITYPATWQVTETTGLVSGLSPVAPKAKGSATFTVIYMNKEGVAMKDFIAREIARAEDTPNFKLVEQTEFKLGDLTAYKLVHHWELGPPSGTSKFVEFLVVTPQRTYAMTAATTLDEYARYAPEIEAILKSFKLK